MYSYNMYIPSCIALHVFFLIQVPHLHVAFRLTCLLNLCLEIRNEVRLCLGGWDFTHFANEDAFKTTQCLQPSVPLPQFSWDEHCCLETQLIRWVPYRLLVSYRILLYTVKWVPRNTQASVGKANRICSAFSLLSRNVWDEQVCTRWDVWRYAPSLMSDIHAAKL